VAPAELIEHLPMATEVILCVANGQLGEALQLIEDRVPDRNRVRIIWTCSDLNLLELLRRGYHVDKGPSRQWAVLSSALDAPHGAGACTRMLVAAVQCRPPGC